MGLGTEGTGARAHALESRSKQSHTTQQQGPKRGRTAVRTADADTKEEGQKTAKGPQHPTREGRDWLRDGTAGGGG